MGTITAAVLVTTLGALVLFLLVRRRHPRFVYEVAPPQAVSCEVRGFPSTGPKQAPVTIVYYGDYECPHAIDMERALDTVRTMFGDSVRIVYKMRSLYSDPSRTVRTAAAYAAFEQGAFEAMHASLLPMPGSRTLSADTVMSRTLRIADSLGLDTAAFRRRLHAPRASAVSASVAEEARYYGIRGVPALFIDGLLLEGGVPAEKIASVVSRALDRLGRSSGRASG
jgi:predicted DsbA family dithiol-disulfide isomerase